MKTPLIKTSYFLALIVALGLLAFSVYLEEKIGLQPCALCILQRWTLLALILILFSGSVLRPLKPMRYIIGTLTFIISSVGMLLSGRQVWLQYYPLNASETCAANLQYMLKVLPFKQVVEHIFKGSVECGRTNWEFLTLSLAEWSLIAFSLFFIFSIWQLYRK